MLFFKAIFSSFQKIKIILRLLPYELKGRWRFAVIFATFLPIADLLLAYWFYLLLMILQGSKINILNVEFSSANLILCLVILVLITLLRQGTELLSVIYSRRLTQAIYRTFAESLVRKYLRLPWLDFSNDNRSTKIKHTITTALDASYSYQIVLNLLGSAATVVFLGSATFIKIPGLALAVVASVLLLLFLNKNYIAKRVENNAEKHLQYQKEYHQHIHEVYELPREIKLYGTEQHFVALVDSQLKRLSKIKSDLAILPLLPKISIEVILTICIASALLIVAHTNKDSHQNLIADFATVAILARRILPSISELLSSYSDLYGSMMNVTEVKKELDYASDLEPDIKREILSENTYIELKDISFKYRESDLILENVNLTFEKGDRLVVFGKTGRGKSTLMGITAGIIKATSGLITFNSSYFNQESTIAYVSQDIKLINGSILDNIVFGRGIADTEKAWKSLELVDLINHVRTLPEGINASIGDNGVKFSGGQRQRLGIARALYIQPQILFLDEATSAVDEQTEAMIMSNIDQYLGEGALMFITHRKSNAERFANKFLHL